MKKTVALMLVLVITIFLCGCGKSQAVKDTEAAILEIGDVTLESGNKITAAEKRYYDLEEKEKKKVGNYELLQFSREVYDSLQRSDYYNAIIMYAERKDTTGIKNVLKYVDYGDKAIKIAVANRNMIVTLTMEEGIQIDGKEDNKPCFLHFYTFPEGGGSPERFGVLADYNTLDFQNDIKAAKLVNTNLIDEVLYTFDLS